MEELEIEWVGIENLSNNGWKYSNDQGTLRNLFKSFGDYGFD